jgi:hypothetical protein
MAGKGRGWRVITGRVDLPEFSKGGDARKRISARYSSPCSFFSWQAMQ